MSTRNDELDSEAMWVTELKEAFEQAATVASSVPEHLQAAAFSKAVDEILSGGRRGRGDRPAPKRRRKNHLTTTNSKAAPPRRPTGAGPQIVVEAMIDEGFFETPRTLESIIQSLEEERGHHFLRRRVATAVLRLLRAQRLKRAKGAVGDYEYTSA